MKKQVLSFFLFSFITLSVALAQQKQSPPVADDGQTHLTINVVGNTLHVQNAAPDSMMSIYSIVGIKLISVRIDSTDQSIDLNLSKGYYLLKISNTVRKLIIK
ncbi:T9SS type A sorting domain-containing protein [uncultured Bacteroides sp.]|uniref:T9SS type A sorting domain-containing protein n=1 Tax=uncultured Bacteroides sp. TaxID=162156 RepID=UPI002AA63299|nr:T9SS type A sorting domain-containing protein [uncultured Bacteroides sp.]